MLPVFLTTARLLCKHLNTRRCYAPTLHRHFGQVANFSTKNSKTPFNKSIVVDNNLDEQNTVGIKHKLFDDNDATIILDVDEERDRILLNELAQPQEKPDPYADLNLKHGETGVFDVEDLISVLRRENAKQIFVARVPQEYAYVDYIVVVTGKSSRHMYALAEFVRKLYKLKQKCKEAVPKLEGKESKTWVALDLGNIALHILTREVRETFDLETLWAVGPEYDDLSQQESDDIMQQFNAILADLKPASGSKSAFR